MDKIFIYKIRVLKILENILENRIFLFKVELTLEQLLFKKFRNR